MRSLECFGAAALVLALVGALSACRPTSGTVSLRFPNQQARAATVRLLVEAYDLDAGLASAGSRSCRDFLGLAADAQPRSGAPERRFYECAAEADGRCADRWFESEPALDIPSGRSLIYVLAYASREANATPFLEGCTDRFDTGGGGDGSDGVAVDLNLVLPRSARVVLSSAGNLVGLPGATPDSPLRIRVEAEQLQFADDTYGIPGVPVAFTVEGDLQILGAAPGGGLEVVTGDNGEAEVRVTLSPEPTVGFVTARSEAVAIATASPSRPPRASVRFVASSVAATSFESTSARVEDLGVPVAVAVGPLSNGASPRLAIVGCRGEAASCARDNPQAPFGQLRLAVFEELAGTPRAMTVELGTPAVLPTDVVIAPLRPGRPEAQIAVLSARRSDCQDRRCTDPETCPCWTLQSGAECPCEGAEIRLFEGQGARIEPAGRLTLTASNAVAFTTYRHPTQSTPRLAIAGQGRSRNDRPCSTIARCFRADEPTCRTDPESCGCPAEESCVCPGCPASRRTGVCAANDRMIDMVAAVEGVDDLDNHLGCRIRDVACNNADPRNGDLTENRCGCDDGVRCTGRDRCNCLIPARVWVGERDSNSFPFDVAAGRFGSPSGDDLVVAADSGLNFFSRDGESFEWEATPLTNRPVVEVTALSLDPNAEIEIGGPSLDDVAWVATGPCTRFRDSCPIVRMLPEAQGCFGVHVSDGAATFFGFEASCRRYELGVEPLSMCQGDFDGNRHPDVAVASEDAVLLFVADGWGGVSFPPQEIAYPPGASGGPMACADIDGDGDADIVVADSDGNVSIFRSGP